ncbi:MAG TPA: DUF692 domain-containing protein [Burkholderiaceae bacterium]|nr:DUF692 domain-containing protein [Burkholderiaceae bacterium]
MAGLGWRHPHFAQVLAERPALDFLEVHSENFFAPGGASAEVLRQGRAAYPISLHGVGLSLGSAAGLDPWHLDQLAALVERTDPVRVSDHASFARAPLTVTRGAPGGPAGGAQLIHAADLLPVPWTHEALHVMVANVQRVQERLRRPIAVENLSAYIQWPQGDWSEPDFLTQLARRSGCHLLVDVNNLMVNALNAHGAPTPQAVAHHPALAQRLLADCTAWLDALGTDVTVAEIHLAGHVHAGDIVIDDHGSRVCDAVWAVYRHAVRRWGRHQPLPTLIEWDTDVPDLAVLLDEVARADAHARQALADTAADIDPQATQAAASAQGALA